ncbi:hypothetical protein CK203_045082 [Vitis vinifera]|uniref:GAG-pre-integrase domain-containing protein n=1 Tax=Vitis vinifera TaxID=29760 RepID=A0A438HD27_VITVI|nr:hypothetical protein CK203_045082 [Vitis vinifera]
MRRVRFHDSKWDGTWLRALHIHVPGDRPGDFITPTRLRGDNYDDWASDIQLALEARRKFEFLEGTITDHNLHIPNLIGTPSMQCWFLGYKHNRSRDVNRKVHDFLMGLNTDLYAQLRTNILSQDPLPSLDRAYQLVIQDECVRLAKAVTEDKPAEVLALLSVQVLEEDEEKTERPVCSHCKKTGHETQLAGPSLLVLTVTSMAMTKIIVMKYSTDQLFTPEQWKALAGLIGNAQVPDDRLNGKFDTKSWIIDTGATHHVTGDLSWLFDTIALFECPVAFLMDHTRDLIGMRVRRDGLYYFGGAEGDSVQHVSVHNAASTLELWHKRMGHPLEKVVKLLSPVRNLKVFEDVFPFGNPGAVNIIPDNIVPTVNVEIDSDFADFVDDDADLPNPQAQTQNPNLIQPEPQAHQDLSPGPEVVPTVGLDSLGLDNTSNGQSAPMGKGMRINFLRFYYEILLLIRWLLKVHLPPLRLHSIPQALLIP